MSYRSLSRRLDKLEALMTPVAPRRIEVCRALDQQPIYSIGEGQSHRLLAMESQVDYLRGFSKRLDLSPARCELLIGDRRSGTSWAALVAAVSLAVVKRCKACVFTAPSGTEDTHRLLRDILPRDWIDDDAEERGFYRLAGGVELHVVRYSRPQSWPEHCEVVMLNDYAYASTRTIEAVLQNGSVQIVTGNPPLDGEPGRKWVLAARDVAKANGLLFRFHARQNQSLMGDPDRIDRLLKTISPDSGALTFWDGTGL